MYFLTLANFNPRPFYKNIAIFVFYMSVFCIRIALCHTTGKQEKRERETVSPINFNSVIALHWYRTMYTYSTLNSTPYFDTYLAY